VLALKEGKISYFNNFKLGGISQSGSRVVYSMVSTLRKYQVIVIYMLTGKTKTIEPGFSPVWLVD
jgi:hypothetical protein